MNHSYFFAIFSSIGVLVLAGCNSPQTSPAQRAELAQEADLPIICKAGKDCDKKWSRAEQWVIQHSAYNIRIHTDTLIQTEEPVDMDKRTAFAIRKTLDNDDIYNIQFKVTCHNWFGCVPPVLEASADFVNFVTSSSVDASKPKLGVRVHPLSASSAQAKGISDTHGVVAVVRVVHNSIGDKAGMHAGDIIVQYNGTPVTTQDELDELVAGIPPEQKVNILIYRDKNTQTLVANK